MRLGGLYMPVTSPSEDMTESCGSSDIMWWVGSMSSHSNSDENESSRMVTGFSDSVQRRNRNCGVVECNGERAR